jgi:O-antigen/teichoic acid export membrane protein
MNIKITKGDVFWSYLGYFLNIGVVLIILPFILKFLPVKEVGLWYTFASIGALVNLVDFGFSSTITRNMSYSWGGAKELVKEGLISGETIGQPNFKLITKIIHATKQIYLILSLSALFILAFPGTIYIVNITKDLSGHTHFIAWVIFGLGICFNLFYSYWTSILRGIGAIKEGQKAVVASKLFQLIITITGLFLGWGLIAVSVGFFVNGFILRIISRKYFKNEMKLFNEDLPSIPMLRIIDKKTYGMLFHNAWRLGVVSIGAFLILQANTLLCASFFGLELTARYGLTLQLFAVLIGISGTVYSALMPEINQACLLNDLIKIKKLISISSTTNWIIYLIGFIFILVLGQQVLDLLRIEIKLLDANLLLFMGVYLFLENNHSMFASFITADNKVPFMKAAIISGILIVIISFSLNYYTNLGLWSLLLSQALVQLCYNNWKWPYVIFKQYDLTVNSIILTSMNYCKTRIKLLYIVN